MATKSRPKRFVFLIFTFVLMFSSLAAVVPAAGSQEPPPINYCDYSQKTGPGDVASWLASAPEGANRDCIDIWIEAQGCGFLDIRIENRIQIPPWTHTLKWTEGTTDVWGSRQDTFPIVFPDGYNDGLGVWVTVVLVTPERDWVDYAGADANLYWSGNVVDQTIFIPTDCTPDVVQWCSPGYWKNNTTMWPVDVDPNMLFSEAVGYVANAKVKGVVTADPNATLLYVIQNPQIYGGGATEDAASYLSRQAGYSGTVPTGDLPVVCPLSGDGNGG